MRTLLLMFFSFGILFLSVLSSFAESPPPKFSLGVGLEPSSGPFSTPSRALVMVFRITAALPSLWNSEMQYGDSR